jgi:site-specific recombinase XerD
LGYSRSGEKRQLQLLVSLSRWLEAECLGLAALASPRVESFFVARRAAGYANLRTGRSLAPLLDYLRRIGVLGKVKRIRPVGPNEVLLDRFRRYLMIERGLVEGTARFYIHIAGLFVAEHDSIDGATFVDLKAAEVTRFATEVCGDRGLSSARQAISALRSFLRFLHVEGLTSVALDDAVLSVAGSSSSPPRAVSPEVVARLVSSCDQRSAIGCRDHAILMLLVRLGLRGGEVAGLELDDFDWRAGVIVVRGKGRRQDRLPLPADVGRAVAVYLQRGRPQVEDRRLFLRCCAPIRGLAGSGAVSAVVARACRVAGVPVVSPHRLRHTLATEMLGAGASLGEIGQVLRHRHISTTAIYAAVDHTRLAALARPWPGGER